MVIGRRLGQGRELLDALAKGGGATLDSVPLRATPDGRLPILAGADCGLGLTCDECDRKRCVGCGARSVVDLDAGTVRCEECLGTDLYRWLGEQYEGRP